METKLIDSIINSYKKGKNIRRNLGMNSKLVIEQKLPYLCVYRFEDSPDKNFVSLLQTQPSYLIKNIQLDISDLLTSLIEVAILDFTSFMIVEIWKDDRTANNTTIRLLHPAEKVTATMEALEKGFNDFKKFLPRIKVVTEDT